MHVAKTFSAYIARQFSAWFGGVFAAMVIITFLLDYIELIRRGGAKIQATLGLLLEMAALKLPHTAQEVLPFAILFGTMLAFWRLTRNNELVVARAAGVSVWQFLTPAVLVAFLIGLVAVTIFNPIGSLTEAVYEKLEGHVLRREIVGIRGIRSRLNVNRHEMTRMRLLDVVANVALINRLAAPGKLRFVIIWL